MALSNTNKVLLQEWRWRESVIKELRQQLQSKCQHTFYTKDEPGTQYDRTRYVCAMCTKATYSPHHEATDFHEAIAQGNTTALVLEAVLNNTSIR